MAFKSKNFETKMILLLLTAFGVPLVAATNIDCGEKPFRCVNSTHFMICVDLGGGVSMTVEDLVMKCPSSTVCLDTNLFECEFPEASTAAISQTSEVINEMQNVTTVQWEDVNVENIFLSNKTNETEYSDLKIFSTESVITPSVTDSSANKEQSVDNIGNFNLNTKDTLTTGATELSRTSVDDSFNERNNISSQVSSTIIETIVGDLKTEATIKKQNKSETFDITAKLSTTNTSEYDLVITKNSKKNTDEQTTVATTASSLYSSVNFSNIELVYTTEYTSNSENTVYSENTNKTELTKYYSSTEPNSTTTSTNETILTINRNPTLTSDKLPFVNLSEINETTISNSSATNIRENVSLPELTAQAIKNSVHNFKVSTQESTSAPDFMYNASTYATTVVITNPTFMEVKKKEIENQFTTTENVNNLLQNKSVSVLEVSNVVSEVISNDRLITSNTDHKEFIKTKDVKSENSTGTETIPFSFVRNEERNNTDKTGKILIPVFTPTTEIIITNTENLLNTNVDTSNTFNVTIQATTSTIKKNNSLINNLDFVKRNETDKSNIFIASTNKMTMGGISINGSTTETPISSDTTSISIEEIRMLQSTSENIRLFVSENDSASLHNKYVKHNVINSTVKDSGINFHPAEIPVKNLVSADVNTRYYNNMESSMMLKPDINASTTPNLTKNKKNNSSLQEDINIEYEAGHERNKTETYNVNNITNQTTDENLLYTPLTLHTPTTENNIKNPLDMLIFNNSAPDNYHEKNTVNMQTDTLEISLYTTETPKNTNETEKNLGKNAEVTNEAQNNIHSQLPSTLSTTSINTSFMMPASVNTQHNVIDSITEDPGIDLLTTEVLVKNLPSTDANTGYYKNKEISMKMKPGINTSTTSDLTKTKKNSSSLQENISMEYVAEYERYNTEKVNMQTETLTITLHTTEKPKNTYKTEENLWKHEEVTNEVQNNINSQLVSIPSTTSINTFIITLATDENVSWNITEVSAPNYFDQNKEIPNNVKLENKPLGLTTTTENITFIIDNTENKNISNIYKVKTQKNFNTNTIEIPEGKTENEYATVVNLSTTEKTLTQIENNWTEKKTEINKLSVQTEDNWPKKKTEMNKPSARTEDWPVKKIEIDIKTNKFSSTSNASNIQKKTDESISTAATSLDTATQYGLVETIKLLDTAIAESNVEEELSNTNAQNTESKKVFQITLNTADTVTPQVANMETLTENIILLTKEGTLQTTEFSGLPVNPGKEFQVNTPISYLPPSSPTYVQDNDMLLITSSTKESTNKDEKSTGKYVEDSNTHVTNVDGVKAKTTSPISVGITENITSNPLKVTDADEIKNLNVNKSANNVEDEGQILATISQVSQITSLPDIYLSSSSTSSQNLEAQDESSSSDWETSNSSLKVDKGVTDKPIIYDYMNKSPNITHVLNKTINNYQSDYNISQREQVNGVISNSYQESINTKITPNILIPNSNKDYISLPTIVANSSKIENKYNIQINPTDTTKNENTEINTNSNIFQLETGSENNKKTTESTATTIRMRKDYNESTFSPIASSTVSPHYFSTQRDVTDVNKAKDKVPIESKADAAKRLINKTYFTENTYNNQNKTEKNLKVLSNKKKYTGTPQMTQYNTFNNDGVKLVEDSKPDSQVFLTIVNKSDTSSFSSTDQSQSKASEFEELPNVTTIRIPQLSLLTTQFAAVSSTTDQYDTLSSLNDSTGEINTEMNMDKALIEIQADAALGLINKNNITGTIDKYQIKTEKNVTEPMNNDIISGIPQKTQYNTTKNDGVKLVEGSKTDSQVSLSIANKVDTHLSSSMVQPQSELSDSERLANVAITTTQKPNLLATRFAVVTLTADQHDILQTEPMRVSSLLTISTDLVVPTTNQEYQKGQKKTTLTMTTPSFDLYSTSNTERVKPSVITTTPFKKAATSTLEEQYGSVNSDSRISPSVTTKEIPMVPTKAPSQSHTTDEAKLKNVPVKQKPNIPTETSKQTPHIESEQKPTVDCSTQKIGRYADDENCRKFYVCSSINTRAQAQPLVGYCPTDTVFSDIKKQCTQNLSHCVRNGQFKCTKAGRFSDYLIDNIYYICVQNSYNAFVRFKFQCQNGYQLNKTFVKCVENIERITEARSFIKTSTKAQTSTDAPSGSKAEGRSIGDNKEEKRDDEGFNCEEEAVAALTDQHNITSPTDKGVILLSVSTTKSTPSTDAGTKQTVPGTPNATRISARKSETILSSDQYILSTSEPLIVSPTKMKLTPRTSANVLVLVTTPVKQKHIISVTEPVRLPSEITEPIIQSHTSDLHSTLKTKPVTLPSIRTTEELTTPFTRHSEFVASTPDIVTYFTSQSVSMKSPSVTTVTKRPITLYQPIDYTTSKVILENVPEHNQLEKPKEPDFDCSNHRRGRYADDNDCRKFYICSFVNTRGPTQPLVGYCPTNTVFSDIKTQCTKNLSHCVRNGQFKCTKAGRFSDYLTKNTYYICVKNSNDTYIRFKFQCQNGYHLEKKTVRCVQSKDVSSQSISSRSSSTKSSEQSQTSTDETSVSKSERRSKEKKKEKRYNNFSCEQVGKFPDPNNCRIYYICTSKKLEFRRRMRRCDSDEVFHKDKKKCVDFESYEC